MKKHSFWIILLAVTLLLGSVTSYAARTAVDMNGASAGASKRLAEYLAGGEAEKYISKHIIPLFPGTMKTGERKKAIKAKIREQFKREKGYPCWAQSSDWPLGKDGRPATYLGKGKSEGDLRRWRFRDESTGEIIVVEQYQ